MDNSRRTAGEGGCHTSTAQHKAPEDKRSGGNGSSETGQRSIRACPLCNSCPELRLESCQGSRTARGMTETSTNAAMDWYHQSRLRNQGPNCRKTGLCRGGFDVMRDSQKADEGGHRLSVRRPPSFLCPEKESCCAAGGAQPDLHSRHLVPRGGGVLAPNVRGFDPPPPQPCQEGRIGGVCSSRD